MFILWKRGYLTRKVNKDSFDSPIKIDESVAESIKSRGFNEWELLVFGCVEGINYLHAEDAVYRRTCYSNFKTDKNIHSKYQRPDSEVNRKRG